MDFERERVYCIGIKTKNSWSTSKCYNTRKCSNWCEGITRAIFKVFCKETRRSTKLKCWRNSSPGTFTASNPNILDQWLKKSSNFNVSKSINTRSHTAAFILTNEVHFYPNGIRNRIFGTTRQQKIDGTHCIALIYLYIHISTSMVCKLDVWVHLFDEKGVTILWHITGFSTVPF